MDVQGNIKFLFDGLVRSDMIHVAMSVDYHYRFKFIFPYSLYNLIRFGSRINDDAFRIILRIDKKTICFQRPDHDPFDFHYIFILLESKGRVKKADSSVPPQINPRILTIFPYLES